MKRFFACDDCKSVFCVESSNSACPTCNTSNTKLTIPCSVMYLQQTLDSDKPLQYHRCILGIYPLPGADTLFFDIKSSTKGTVKYISMNPEGRFERVLSVEELYYVAKIYMKTKGEHNPKSYVAQSIIRTYEKAM